MADCEFDSKQQGKRPPQKVTAKSGLTDLEVDAFSNMVLEKIRDTEGQGGRGTLALGVKTGYKNLQIGYDGAARAIQQRMNVVLAANNFPKIREDGFFQGLQFQCVAMLIQRASGLDLSPHVGPKTLRVLDSVSPDTAKDKDCNVLNIRARMSPEEIRMLETGKWEKLFKSLFPHPL